MTSIKTYLNSLGRTTRTILLGLAVIFGTAGIAQAATTITTDISTGALTLTGALTGTSGAFSTTLTVTATTTTNGLTVSNAATLASTTATSFKVGQLGTRMTQVVSGYCVTTSSDVTASTTTMLTCTPVTGVTVPGASDRVFVMATSSLPGRIYIQSASSTGSVIQVNVFNTGINGGAPGAAVYAFNFWSSL